MEILRLIIKIKLSNVLRNINKLHEKMHNYLKLKKKNSTSS